MGGYIDPFTITWLKKHDVEAVVGVSGMKEIREKASQGCRLPIPTHKDMLLS